MTSFKKRSDEGRAESPRLTALGSSRSPGIMVGCTPLGQSDRVSNALDEVLGRAFPWNRRIIAPRFRPHASHQGGRAGIEPAKPCTPPRQSSVSPYVSNRPTKLWPENSGEPLLVRYVTLQRLAPVGLAPTPPDQMYSEPAVGLYSMGDEVLARAMLYPLSYAPHKSCESRDGWNRTNNRCTPTGSRPLCFLKGPTKLSPRHSLDRWM